MASMLMRLSTRYSTSPPNRPDTQVDVLVITVWLRNPTVPAGEQRKSWFGEDAVVHSACVTPFATCRSRQYCNPTNIARVPLFSGKVNVVAPTSPFRYQRLSPPMSLKVRENRCSPLTVAP